MDSIPSESQEAPAGAVLKTLVCTDLVDSTKLLERLGDKRAADLFERHDRIARDLLARHGGREIDKSDGFLLLFDRPLDAVRFSLDYHRALADTSRAEGVELHSRAAVHLGEVFLRESSRADIARGAKPLEVDGLAKPIGFRVMSVALGKQTLLTRAAFDVARRASVGEQLCEGELSWATHGPYLFKGVDEPLELFEVGVVGQAPLTAPRDAEKARRVVSPGDATTVEERLQAALRDRYVLEDQLDRGGRGSVYRAHDVKHNRKVAIKAVLPEVAAAVGVKRLLQEITTAARLNHPHILPLHDSGEVGGLVYYVMPFVTGESLEDRLAREKRLPLEDVIRIAGEVGSALDRTHREGVIHGDIKPANILLEGNHAVVTGFGIARAVDAADEAHEAKAARFLGSAAYTSPEQASGSTDIDGRSDLYSVGCIVYEMLSGHPPFEGPSVRQTLAQHIVAPVPSLKRVPAGVPDHVEHAIMKALKKNPADRFSTLIEFANALARSSPEADRRPAETTSSATAAPSPHELRHLTVMFSDVSRSGSRAGDADPETQLELIREYMAACDEAVRRFEGRIVQFQDNGVVAYFGHPVAHEDDAVRAGLASLAVLHAIQDMNSRLEHELGIRLSARVGLHSGPTVMGRVGTSERGEQLAIGIAPAVAARLRDQAPPDGVLVSDLTYRLFRGYFTCQDMGTRTLDGVRDAVGVHRLLAESGSGRRLQGVAASALPPLVGRDSELATLLDLWERSNQGLAQVALLGGEAGIGKSRLVAAVQERLEGEAHLVLDCGCSPYHASTALYAVIEMLERWVGIVRDDRPAARLRKLEEAVLEYLKGDPHATALLADLLSIPLDDRYPPLELEPAHQRKRTLEVLLAMLGNASKQRPVLLVMEDLHWIDPSTLEFLTAALDRARTARMMLLLTSRPDFTPPWDAPHVTEIVLGGLAESQVAAVVAGVPGGEGLPTEVIDRIVRQSDGVPLFIEETTKALLESEQAPHPGSGHAADGSATRAAVPLTLRDALEARIERLGSAKAVVQLGAVIGRRFAADLLLEVSDHEDWVVLSGELRRAVDAGILVAEGAGPQTTYTFRHALIQENAYSTLARKTRESHHRRIMEALEKSLPSAAETTPELLAHHCTEAGAVEKAIPYWLRAGQRGIARAAFAESIHHLDRGLDLVGSLPDGPGRDRTELALQTALGMAVQASKGYAAPEAERAYDRARVLCRKGGAAEELLPVLWGQYLFYAVRADYRTGEEVCAQMLAVSKDGGGAEQRMVAHLASGLNELYLGKLVESRDHFREGLRLYEPQAGTFHQYHSLGDPGVWCNSYLARTLWILGDVDEALDLSHESLTLARTRKIPLARAQSLGMHTLLLLVRRDNALAQQYAAEALEYAGRHGFAYWLVLSSMCQAWLTAQDGAVEEGIAKFSRFLGLYQAQGALLGLSWFFGVLAQMHSQRGDMDEAFRLLALAAAHIEETGERYYEAEISRLEGEMELLRGGAAAAEAAQVCFQRALDASRRQCSLSWELRASGSLARVWRDQGKTREARSLLADVLGRIQGAADPSPDHADALELLDELAAPA